MEDELVKKNNQIYDLAMEIEDKNKMFAELNKKLQDCINEKNRQYMKGEMIINNLRSDLKKKNDENLHLRNRLGKLNGDETTYR